MERLKCIFHLKIRFIQNAIRYVLKLGGKEEGQQELDHHGFPLFIQWGAEPLSTFVPNKTCGVRGSNAVTLDL